jgi:multiple sugar transport system permease protein
MGLAMTLKKESIVPYMFIFPAIFLILLFKIYPVFTTFVDGFRYRGHWTLSVYKRVFTDLSIWNSLWITIKFNLVLIPTQIVISFILALLVNTTIKGISIFRTIFYLPVTVSLTIAIVLWTLMLDPNGGIVNGFISLINIPPQGFFIEKGQALWSIVAICVWKGVGYLMMFILAGLKNVDNGIYESAKIDGANFFRVLFKITLPLMKRVMLFVLVIDTVSNVLVFIPMQMVTLGGPESSTNVLMMEAYRSFFLYGDRGRGSIICVMLIVIIAAISIVQFKILNKKDE